MQLDIEQIIDRAKLGPLHWRVLILCALVTLLDGYDVQAMASATPSLAADWHVAPGGLRWIVRAWSGVSACGPAAPPAYSFSSASLDFP